MSDVTFSLILFSSALFHAWLQIYNRYLLVMDDSRIKLPLHFFSLIFMVIVPCFLMFFFRDQAIMNRLLSWKPENMIEGFGFAALFSLSMVMLWRFGMVLSDTLIQDRSHRILREIHRSVPVEKPRSSLPIIIRDQDTTWDIEFRDVDIQVRHLPAEFDGISVILASDLHYESNPKVMRYLEEIRHFVNALNADIIAFSGDFVNHTTDIRQSMEFHGEFEARIAKIGVMGNHDYWTRPRLISRLAAKNGIKLLTDERYELTREGRKLVFCGTDSPWNHEPVPWNNLTHGHETDCLVMLSHTPDNGPEASNNHVNLILSGHNHGGQIRLPAGLGPVAVPSKFGRKYSDGIFDLHESCAMVVSRGIGCSRVGSFGFLRMNCRPEIIRLNLRAPVLDIPVRVNEVHEKIFKLEDSDSGILTRPAFRSFKK